MHKKDIAKKMKGATGGGFRNGKWVKTNASMPQTKGKGSLKSTGKNEGEGSMLIGKNQAQRA